MGSMRSSGWKPLRPSIRRTAALAGFLLATAVLWSVVLFPSDEITRYMQCRIGRVLPDAVLSVGRVGLSLPPGVAMADVALSMKGQPALRIAAMRFEPAWLSLFEDRARHPLTGRLKLSEIRMTLSLPVIGSLDFRQILADIGWKGEEVEIASLTAAGDQMDGRLSGRIRVETPVEKSRLQISGVLHLKPEILDKLKAVFPAAGRIGQPTGEGGIPFQIAGTLAAPQYSFKPDQTAGTVRN